MLCFDLCCWLSCFSKSVTVSKVDIAFKSFKEYIEQKSFIRCACMFTCMFTCSTGTIYTVCTGYSDS